MLQPEEIQHAIDQVFARYPGTPIHLSSLEAMVVTMVGAVPSTYRDISDQVRKHIQDQAAAGHLNIHSKHGGVFKPAPKAQALQSASSMPPTNDHVCPCCGDKRVSKSESKCWVCGGSLH